MLSLDVSILKNNLDSKSRNNQQIIELPNLRGGVSKIKETSNFEADLATKFPMIKSYSAQGMDDPTAVAKISVGVDGFHAVIFSGNEKTIYVDPFFKDNRSYMVYKRSTKSDNFTCQVEEFSKKGFTSENTIENANDGKLRTFRLALVCSVEYAHFHLTR